MMSFFVEMEAAAGSRGPTSKSEISLLPACTPDGLYVCGNKILLKELRRGFYNDWPT